ncbi:tryptophan 7-halogenase [Cellvibrio sp.]|uniref:tryptophan 7-halogenase n=1 Tax=Cellvibrio sp. TaxID=1965322 RepID=UPI0039647B14
MKKKIIVLGDGVAGVSVACLLAKQLPRDSVSIQVIRDREANAELPEFARSTIHRFHDLIGLPERNVVFNSNANFGFGVWYQSDKRNYILAEGIYGSPLDGADFLSAFFTGLELGIPYRLDDFSLNAVAARSGRFGHPIADPASIYSVIQYGLHLEPISYAHLLKHHALSLGVQFLASESKSIKFSGDELMSIELADGEVIEGDLYINCSRHMSQQSQNLMVGESGSIETIFDSIAYGHRPLSRDTKRTVQLQEDENGFLQSIPLRNTEYLAYAYSSRHTDSVAVHKKLNLMGADSVAVKQLAQIPISQRWIRNCVDLIVEPSLYDLFMSPLSRVRDGAVRLLDLLTSFEDYSDAAYEFNRLTNRDNNQVREFVELNLYSVRNTVIAAGDYFQANALSESAQHRLDLFAAYGRHPQHAGAILSDVEWSVFWSGNQFLPKTTNPGLFKPEPESVKNHLYQLKEFIYKAVDKMPMHVDYLSRVTHS